MGGEHWRYFTYTYLCRTGKGRSFCLFLGIFCIVESIAVCGYPNMCSFREGAELSDTSILIFIISTYIDSDGMPSEVPFTFTILYESLRFFKHPIA